MAFQFRYLPDVALADIAFEVEADSWDDLFAGAAAAMTGVMVNVDDLATNQQRTIELEAVSVDELLFDWLGELVYLKDTESLLVHTARVQISTTAGWRLHAELLGDRIDGSRQRLGQDVKAVTLHMFEVTMRGSSHYAHVVLDI